jgi:hypothetical protein
MIPEEQRRALHALREALRLCDDAMLLLDLGECVDFGLRIENISTGEILNHIRVNLDSTDISMILEAHPE